MDECSVTSTRRWSLAARSSTWWRRWSTRAWFASRWRSRAALLAAGDDPRVQPRSARRRWRGRRRSPPPRRLLPRSCRERPTHCLIGADQVTWLDRLEAEHGNLVVGAGPGRAMLSARARPTSSGVPATLAGLRLAGGLHWFWWLGGHVTEGRRWLAEVLTWDAGDEGLPARTRALYAAGTLAMIQGDYEEAHQHLDEAVRLAESLGDVVRPAAAWPTRASSRRTSSSPSVRGRRGVRHRRPRGAPARNDDRHLGPSARHLAARSACSAPPQV